MPCWNAGSGKMNPLFRSLSNIVCSPSLHLSSRFRPLTRNTGRTNENKTQCIPRRTEALLGSPCTLWAAGTLIRSTKTDRVWQKVESSFLKSHANITPLLISRVFASLTASPAPPLSCFVSSDIHRRKCCCFREEWAWLL